MKRFDVLAIGFERCQIRLICEKSVFLERQTDRERERERESERVYTGDLRVDSLEPV